MKERCWRKRCCHQLAIFPVQAQTSYFSKMARHVTQSMCARNGLISTVLSCLFGMETALTSIQLRTCGQARKDCCPESGQATRKIWLMRLLTHPPDNVIRFSQTGRLKCLRNATQSSKHPTHWKLQKLCNLQYLFNTLFSPEQYYEQASRMISCQYMGNVLWLFT